MADLELLGVFEDGPQRDFVSGVVEALGASPDRSVVIEPRLTAGCRFDYLQEHLALASRFAGVIVGVDGAGHPRAEKTQTLMQRCDNRPPVCLWAVAEPSIEEWIMADEEALPGALRELFGAGRVRHVSRPGRAQAERTAKQRLRDWIEALLGEPALQGGVEYARDVGRRVNPNRVGRARNPDFREFLERLPAFLGECTVRPQPRGVPRS